MNCKVTFGLKKSLSRRSVCSLPPRVFCEPVVEIFRDLPGSASNTWCPMTRDSLSYRELDQTLLMLPSVLVTVVRRVCSFITFPTTRKHLAERRGIGALQTYLGRLRAAIDRVNYRDPSRDYQDDLERLADIRDEFCLELPFPSSQFENCFHRGFGHAMATIENDLCELREMAQNPKRQKSDLVPLIYECRRILRKANLLRWAVNVFLEICLPLTCEHWKTAASDPENALLSAESVVLQSMDRLKELSCLASAFWHHKTVCSALEKLRRAS